MKYNELYTITTGFIKTLLDNEQSQEGIAHTLFSEFDNPDLYIVSKIGDKTLLNLFESIIKSDNNIDVSRKKIAETILSVNEKNWLRIKNVMNENYEVFLVADEQYTENVSESKELENTAIGSTQNKINAFDSATASDTDKIETSNSGTGAETNTRAMTYRKQSTGAMFTPQELLQKEIDLRTNNKFLDLVIKDIKNVLCLDVYE